MRGASLKTGMMVGVSFGLGMGICMALLHEKMMSFMTGIHSTGCWVVMVFWFCMDYLLEIVLGILYNTFDICREYHYLTCFLGVLTSTVVKYYWLPFSPTRWQEIFIEV